MPSRTVRPLAAGLAIACCVMAGCSSSPSLTEDETKVCLAAAEEDWRTVAEDLPLIENEDIRKHGERLGADVQSSTRMKAMMAIVKICTDTGWRNVVAEAKASEQAAVRASEAALAGRTPTPLRSATLPAPVCKGKSMYSPSFFSQSTLDLDTGKVVTKDVPATDNDYAENPMKETPGPSTPAKQWIEYYVATCLSDSASLGSNMFTVLREVQQQPKNLRECKQAEQEGAAVGEDTRHVNVDLVIGKQFCVTTTSTDGSEKGGLYFAVTVAENAEGGDTTPITISYAIY